MYVVHNIYGEVDLVLFFGLSLFSDLLFTAVSGIIYFEGTGIN
jgi:hypothetical protein